MKHDPAPMNDLAIAQHLIHHRGKLDGVGFPASAQGHSVFGCAALALLFALLAAPAIASDAELAAREEAAMQAAVARVAPSVVSIETVGGLERVGQVLF